jgi:hypothetical protein
MKVKDLLRTPHAWTQKTLAKDMNGNKVSPGDPSACCFCLYGAVCYCYSEPNTKLRVLNLIRSTLRLPSVIEITSWNDAKERTLEEVIAIADALDI